MNKQKELEKKLDNLKIQNIMKNSKTIEEKIEDTEKKLVKTMEQRQKSNGDNAAALEGVKKINTKIKQMEQEAKDYGNKEIKNEKKLDNLKQEEKKLNDEKNKTSEEYEKSMTQISELDKNFNDDTEQGENSNENPPDDTKGTKLGDQDLERVLNFYGDMDKPNNEQKINNQEINTNLRDW